jgi:hypothetical protein
VWLFADVLARNWWRCHTPAEMLEVVQVRLGDDAAAKLGEARARFADFPPGPEEPGDRPMPPPQPATEAPESVPPAEPTEATATGTGGPAEGDPTQPASGGAATFAPVQGPANRPPKKRKLVVAGAPRSGGGGCGPLATEAVTFKVVEAFERAEDRFVIPVSHLRGEGGFGCDLLSVGSAEVRDAAMKARSINEADILRHIEVKRRSSRSGEVELTDNEFQAAKRLAPNGFSGHSG